MNEKQFDNNKLDAKISGVVTGIVKENYDDEYPGMVKVEVRSREKGANITDWVRVATPYAGNDRGVYFLPEVGDEVLVAYAYGDVHKPYVIGSLWNKKVSKHPKKVAVEENTIKKIRTRCGHEIIFNEEDGKEDIDIHTPKGLKVQLNDEKEVITVTDKSGDNFMKIDSKNGEIKITAKKCITLASGSSSVKIDNNAKKITITSDNVQIDAKQALKLKGQNSEMAGAMTTVSASGTLNLKGDGPTNLKGAVVKIN